MFQNDAGIAFFFFIAASLLFLCLSLNKLGLTLRKGSMFHMISMMLLAVSTFCTDDGRIINLNKTAIFLLMMSLLLNQFYETSSWKLGKYLGSICRLVFLSIGELGAPFADGAHYYRTEGKKNKTFWNGLLGIIIAIPLLFIVAGLLGGADALFREMTNDFFEWIQPGNIFNVLFRIAFIFLGSYLLTAFLCKRSIKEEVADKRKGEPALAITITSLLTLVYILFSGIQIFGLFLGRMELPEGYTYAMYAREGFFQLLAVSVLNLVIVLCTISYFRDNKVLKMILTLMSLSTFVMIASSAMRMIIYIRYYYMTFLRIFVLWALIVLFFLFAGVVISIYKQGFPLFKYSMTVVSVLYIALSFSHPDYIIAQINVTNAVKETTAELDVKELRENLDYGDEFFAGPFFLGDYYTDYEYLSQLSADAAPVLIPYMEELGYDLRVYYQENIWENLENQETRRWRLAGFGNYYLESMKETVKHLSPRTFNVSRYMVHLQLKERLD